MSTYIVFENTHAQQRACDNYSNVRVTTAASETEGVAAVSWIVVDRVVRVTTAASETEGVAAVSWGESLMIRRPLGSIDPNSIRETELHTESRRRHSRGERESLHSPQLHRERDAARQRAAATRRRETDEARAERCVCHSLRVSSRTHLVRRRNEY